MTDFLKHSDKCIKTPTKCLFWTGGKLYCLDVCDGEKLETIIKKIDKKFENIHELLDISDLSLDSVLGERDCPPENLKGVVQLILNHIQDEVDSSSQTSGSTSFGEVTVPNELASYFGGSTTVPLDNAVAVLLNIVTLQQSTISNFQQSIAQLTANYGMLSNQVSQIIGG